MAITNQRILFQAHRIDFGKKFEEFHLNRIMKNVQGAFYVWIKGNDLFIKLCDETLAQFVLKSGKADIGKLNILRLLEDRENIVAGAHNLVSEANSIHQEI